MRATLADIGDRAGIGRVWRMCRRSHVSLSLIGYKAVLPDAV
ncbi:MAG TPA: hypothetical protein VGV59_01490 [Pyrinomonadaceae bacterium]|nr:hypothetical protein [Pyrinomonadaceae bacterium]